MRSAAERSLPSMIKTGDMSEGVTKSLSSDRQRDEPDLKGELLQIKSGDSEAMARFYDATASRALAIARSILRQKEDAEEAVFDAYTQIWETADRYRSERSTPIGWLTMIVRSRALDRLRRRKAIRDTGDGQDDVQALIDPAPSPDSLLDLMDESSAVYQAMSDLTSIQRHVITLAYFRDYTHAEIAECLDMPIGTIKSHVHRAVNSMRQSLGNRPGGHHE